MYRRQYLQYVGVGAAGCLMSRTQPIYADTNRAHWQNRHAGQPFFSVFNHAVCPESLLHKSEPAFEALRQQWKIQRHDPAKVTIPPKNAFTSIQLN